MASVKIHVFKSRTINLGNYNSAKIEFGIDGELPEDATFADVIKQKKKYDDLIDDWLETEHGKWTTKSGE